MSIYAYKWILKVWKNTYQFLMVGTSRGGKANWPRPSLLEHSSQFYKHIQADIHTFYSFFVWFYKVRIILYTTLQTFCHWNVTYLMNIPRSHSLYTKARFMLSNLCMPYVEIHTHIYILIQMGSYHHTGFYFFFLMPSFFSYHFTCFFNSHSPYHGHSHLFLPR